MLGSPNKGTNGGLARTPIPSHNTNKSRIHQNIIWACAKKKKKKINKFFFLTAVPLDGFIQQRLSSYYLSFFFVLDLMPPCQSDVVFFSCAIGHLSLWRNQAQLEPVSIIPTRTRKCMTCFTSSCTRNCKQISN